MAKGDKQSTLPESSTEVSVTESKNRAGEKFSLSAERVNAPPLVATGPVLAALTDGPITFDMYCTIRQIPMQRRAGLRAYTDRQSATLREWATVFKNY